MLPVFRELRINGDPERLEELVRRISTGPVQGWRRDVDYEEARRGDLGATGRPYFVFRWQGDQARPSAILFLFQRGSTLRVTNIIPATIRELDQTAYNEILGDFADRQVGPAARELGLGVDLSADRLELTDWLSERAASLLVHFSANANRTGLHPLDRERWQRFLVQVHRDEVGTGNQPDSGLLERWLIEEEGWPVQAAQDLTAEFEGARSLLKQYDLAQYEHAR